MTARPFFIVLDPDGDDAIGCSFETRGWADSAIHDAWTAGFDVTGWKIAKRWPDPVFRAICKNRRNKVARERAARA